MTTYFNTAHPPETIEPLVWWGQFTSANGFDVLDGHSTHVSVHIDDDDIHAGDERLTHAAEHTFEGLPNPRELALINRFHRPPERFPAPELDLDGDQKHPLAGEQVDLSPRVHDISSDDYKTLQGEKRLGDPFAQSAHLFRVHRTSTPGDTGHALQKS